MTLRERQTGELIKKPLFKQYSSHVPNLCIWLYFSKDWVKSCFFLQTKFHWIWQAIAGHIICEPEAIGAAIPKDSDCNSEWHLEFAKVQMRVAQNFSCLDFGWVVVLSGRLMEISARRKPTSYPWMDRKYFRGGSLQGTAGPTGLQGGQDPRGLKPKVFSSWLPFSTRQHCRLTIWKWLVELTNQMTRSK